MNKIYFVILLVLCSSLFFVSCEKHYSINRYAVPDDNYPANSIAVIESFYPEDYISTLESVIVQDFVFDSNNTMWVLTNMGLIKKDASEVSNSFLISYLGLGHSAYSITLDHSDNLWINTSKGILLYEQVEDRFTHYSVENNNLPTNYTSKVYCDENSKLYFSCYAGVFKFENNQWVLDENFPQNLEGFDFMAIQINISKPSITKKDGFLWILMHSGVLKYKNDSTYEYFESSNFFFPTGIYTDNQNRIWIDAGTKTNMFDGENWHFFTIGNNLVVNEKYILLNKFGVPNGIDFFINNEWKNLISDKYFTLQSFRDAGLDKDQNLWLSSSNGGIHRINSEFLQ
jgi:ligand-binding sensor domain-containing protein